LSNKIEQQDWATRLSNNNKIEQQQQHWATTTTLSNILLATVLKYVYAFAMHQLTTFMAGRALLAMLFGQERGFWCRY
jgi:hypothetical protein